MIKIKAERNRQNYKIELGYPNYNVINVLNVKKRLKRLCSKVGLL